jgi:hypothetical protein
MLSVSLVATLLAAAAAQQLPKVSPDDQQRVVEECVAPADRDRAMSDLTPQARRALIACAQASTARTLNARMPIRVDEITTVESVAVEGATLVYHNRLDIDLAQVPADARSRIERSTRDYVCAQADMVQTIGHGGAYGYVWRDRSGALIHRMTVSAC